MCWLSDRVCWLMFVARCDLGVGCYLWVVGHCLLVVVGCLKLVVSCVCELVCCVFFCSLFFSSWCWLLLTSCCVVVGWLSFC